MLPAGGEAPAETFLAILRERAPLFSVSLPPAALAPLSRYLALLDRARRETNLTGPIGTSELADHALESCVASDLLPAGGRVADIGSGAGFPGVPLAILRADVRITPVEPRRRRRDFLDGLAAALGIANLERAAPSVAALPREGFEAAVTRAVGRLGAVLTSAEFLTRDGTLLAWTTDAAAVGRDVASSFDLLETRRIPGARRKVIARFTRRPGRRST